MPNRIIKESICTSEAINKLNSYQETFLYRLIVNCDDYGRMDAQPAILKARLYPIKERVGVKEIEDALKALADAGCIKLYTAEQKPYLYIPEWEAHQQIRAKKSKYPAPDGQPEPIPTQKRPRGNQKISSDITRNHLKSDDCKRLQKQAKSKPVANLNTEEDPLAGFDGELLQKLEEWLRYKAERRKAYKPTGLRSLVSVIKNKQKIHTDAEICALMTECMANGWEGIRWDRLTSGAKQCQSARTAGSSLDYNAIDAMVDGQFGGKSQ